MIRVLTANYTKQNGKDVCGLELVDLNIYMRKACEGFVTGLKGNYKGTGLAHIKFTGDKSEIDTAMRENGYEPYRTSLFIVN